MVERLGVESGVCIRHSRRRLPGGAGHILRIIGDDRVFIVVQILLIVFNGIRSVSIGRPGCGITAVACRLLRYSYCSRSCIQPCPGPACEGIPGPGRVVQSDRVALDRIAFRIGNAFRKCTAVQIIGDRVLDWCEYSLDLNVCYFALKFILVVLYAATAGNYIPLHELVPGGRSGREGNFFTVIIPRISRCV